MKLTKEKITKFLTDCGLSDYADALTKCHCIEDESVCDMATDHEVYAKFESYASSIKKEIIVTQDKHNNKLFVINVPPCGCFGLMIPKGYAKTSTSFKFVIFNRKYGSAIDKFNEL